MKYFQFVPEMPKHEVTKTSFSRKKYRRIFRNFWMKTLSWCWISAQSFASISAFVFELLRKSGSGRMCSPHPLPAGSGLSMPTPIWRHRNRQSCYYYWMHSLIKVGREKPQQQMWRLNADRPRESLVFLLNKVLQYKAGWCRIAKPSRHTGRLLHEPWNSRTSLKSAGINNRACLSLMLPRISA